MGAHDPRQWRHLPNTKAYLRYREQTQAAFDFAFVVCHAFPSLKRQISLLNRGVVQALPDPDYFAANDPNQLRERAKGYKQRLAAYTLITNFSFFEAFVSAAIEEMVAFHGGPEKLQRKAEIKERRFMEQGGADIEKHRRILQRFS